MKNTSANLEAVPWSVSGSDVFQERISTGGEY
jgi:hypothetical protein